MPSTATKTSAKASKGASTNPVAKKSAGSKSSGQPDAVDLLISDPLLEKLAFIHDVIVAGVRGEFAMNFGSSDTPFGAPAPAHAPPLAVAVA